jgi:hypothetical protein
MSKSQWMSNVEVCSELQVSLATLQRYRRDGTGPAFYRFPSGVRYSRADFESWLAAHRVAVA